MIETYFPLAVIVVLAAALSLIIILASVFLGPQKRSDIKNAPFECGTIGSNTMGERFGVKYLVVAIIFVVFDVELALLYPWAVQLGDIGWPTLWLALPFILALEIGLLYLWRRGPLNWLR